jgi:hypothetical protein
LGESEGEVGGCEGGGYGFGLRELGTGSKEGCVLEEEGAMLYL